MSASSSAIITAIIVDLLICLCIFFAFSFLRVLPWTRNLWAPKSYAPKLNPQEVKPPEIPADTKSFFAWLPAVLSLTERQIIETAGLDAAVLMRVLRFGCEAFVYVSFLSLVTMLPVNLTVSFLQLRTWAVFPPVCMVHMTSWCLIMQDDNVDILMNGPDADQYKFTGFDKCGLANVQEESMRM